MPEHVKQALANLLYLSRFDITEQKRITQEWPEFGWDGCVLAVWVDKMFKDGFGIDATEGVKPALSYEEMAGGL